MFDQDLVREAKDDAVQLPDGFDGLNQLVSQAESLLNNNDLARAIDRALDLLSEHGRDMVDTCSFVLLEQLRDRMALPQPDSLSPADTGVGEYCAPGPAESQEPVWLLRFEDIDKSDQFHFDETSALSAFARAESLGWNCYLFEQVKRNKKSQNDCIEGEA